MTFEPDTRCPCDVREAVNHGDRNPDLNIDILLLHYTGMISGQDAEDWLCREESGVSCHYLVHEDGRIVQMVPEKLRAWHAGKSSWQDEADTNSRSIGIEIVNPGHDNGYPDFPEGQIEAVVNLSLDIINRRNIPARHVLAHSDVAPGRKQDPGEKFPWYYLHKRGVGHWAEAGAKQQASGFWQLGDNGEPIAALQAMLALYGYGIEITGNYNQKTKDCIKAFQMHFRQGNTDGIADGETIAILDALIQS
ncbi:MAG: N-acetylmuramoyl-L-alanine amidase [Pseudomonadota bacterium]